MEKEIIEIQEITNARMIPNYEHMIEDLKSLVVRTEVESRMMFIEGYHELGKQLINYGLNKPEFLSQVSQDIGKSKRTIYRVLQFVEMFPDLESLPEGLDMSWHKICNKYLVGNSEIENEEFTMPLDELSCFLYENCTAISERATFNKNGVVIRLSRDLLEKYMGERNA
jgi:hypothetical protein